MIVSLPPDAPRAADSQVPEFGSAARLALFRGPVGLVALGPVRLAWRQVACELGPNMQALSVN